MATKAGQFANSVENKVQNLEEARSQRATIADSDGGPLAMIDDYGNLVLQNSNIPKKDALALSAFILDQFTPLP
jgi:hypothetical protein